VGFGRQRVDKMDNTNVSVGGTRRDFQFALKVPWECFHFRRQHIQNPGQIFKLPLKDCQEAHVLSWHYRFATCDFTSCTKLGKTADALLYSLRSSYTTRQWSFQWHYKGFTVRNFFGDAKVFVSRNLFCHDAHVQFGSEQVTKSFRFYGDFWGLHNAMNSRGWHKNIFKELYSKWNYWKSMENILKKCICSVKKLFFENGLEKGQWNKRTKLSSSRDFSVLEDLLRKWVYLFAFIDEKSVVFTFYVHGTEIDRNVTNQCFAEIVWKTQQQISWRYWIKTTFIANYLSLS